MGRLIFLGTGDPLNDERAQTGLALIVPITVAALAYIDKFDFAGRPGGLVYIGIYVVVGIAVCILLLSRREREVITLVADGPGDHREARDGLAVVRALEALQATLAGVPA